MKRIVTSIIIVCTIFFLFLGWNFLSAKNELKPVANQIEKKTENDLAKEIKKEAKEANEKMRMDWIQKQTESQKNIDFSREEFESISEYAPERYGPEMNVNGEQRIPILIFHEIRKDYNGDNGVIISEKTFEEYMLYIKALGYQAITFDDYKKFIAGEKKIAQNSIIVTFDDGYLSNYTLAYPIMKSLGIKGMVAILGNRIDSENKYLKDVEHLERLQYLSWDNVKEMEESGVFRIESHTYNLHDLGDGITTAIGTMPLKDEAEEATEGRIARDDILFQQKMQNYIGRRADVFVYPFGKRSEISDKAYNKLGYNFTLGTENGISDLNTEKNSLKRINTVSSKSAAEVLNYMLKLEGKSTVLPCSEITDQNERIAQLRLMIENK